MLSDQVTPESAYITISEVADVFSNNMTNTYHLKEGL